MDARRYGVRSVRSQCGQLMRRLGSRSALDVSGGHHTLAAGLERLSFETGGYYLPTWDFPRWAMKTAASAIKGHYVLVFRPPSLPERGFHEIRIEGPSGVKLLYRQGYED